MNDDDLRRQEAETVMGGGRGGSKESDPLATRVADASAGKAATGEIPAVREHPHRYRSLGDHSSGGMGKIMLVHDEHLNRDIAFKQLLPDQLRAAGTRADMPTSEMLTIPIVARFVQEARITGQLEHPAIVPVYELGYRDDGSLYYTMKFVRGRTLQDALQSAGTLAGRLQYLTHFLDICNAIAYAHSKGVIHRDLKPLNIMVGEFGETVVIDWGIAKILGREDIHARDIASAHNALHRDATASSTKTMYGQAMGSPYYMPPEQAQGRIDEIDERSDIYALGAVLYAILAGRAPYLGMTPGEFARRVVTEAPMPVRQGEKDVPPELAAVCDKAMQRNRADRYASAKEMADEIQNYLSGGLVRAHTYRFREHFMRFVRRYKTILATVAVGLLVLAAVAVYSYVRVVQERDRAEQNYQRAETERNRADVARKDAETQRKAAERELYYANISLAERCIREQRMNQARDLLGACPEELRQWEWGRLEYLCNADRMTLTKGGQFTGFLKDGSVLVTGALGGAITLENLGDGATLRTLVEQAGYNFDLALCPGASLVAVSTDKMLGVWNADAESPVFMLPETEAGSSGHHSVGLSPDGRYLAALCGDGKVRVWALDGAKSDSPLLTIEVEAPSSALVAFAPGQPRLMITSAVMTDDGMAGLAELYDLSPGGKPKRLPLQASQMVKGAVFSPDGKYAAIGTNDGVLLWDGVAGAPAHQIKAAVAQAQAMAFSPDGLTLAVGAQSGALYVWDVAAGRELYKTGVHQDFISAVGFAPDGKRVYTAGTDRIVKVLDAATGRELALLRGHNAAIMAMAVAPKGDTLATGGYDGTTKIWDVGNAMEYAEIGVAAFCPVKNLLAGSVGSGVVLWETRLGREVRRFEGHSGKVYAVALSSDGQRLACAVQESRGGAAVSAISLWDATSGTLLRTLETRNPQVFSMAFSGNGACLAARSGDVAQLWDTATGAERASIEKAVSFAVSNDAKLAAVACEDGSVVVLEPGSGKELRRHKTEVQRGVALAFSGDGARLVASSERLAGNTFLASLICWDTATGEQRFSVDAHKGAVTSLCFAPDGSVLLSTGADRLAKLWDAQSGKELASLRGHAGTKVLGASFSADGARIATAGDDGTFKLWERESGRELLTVQDSALHQQGQSAAPLAAAFADDDRSLASITGPVALAPRILTAFPWKPGDFPGDSKAKLQERIEQYKRAAWSGR